MAFEAYSVGFEKANFHAPIDNPVNKELVLNARESEITNNLLSYIGEYRLGVKFDEYFYNESVNPVTGERHLSSSDSGPIRDVYRKSISERERAGLSVRREVAECLGFEKLEKELLDREEGAMAVWVSPPGQSEDGYGDYSFTFIGQVVNGENGRRIRMIPYRNELPLTAHNKYLSDLAGREVNFQTDVEFLNNPYVFDRRLGVESPEDILKLIGEEEEFDDSWRNEFVKRGGGRLLQLFLYQVRKNYPDGELKKTLNALEHFGMDLKREKRNAHLLIEDTDFGARFSATRYVETWGEQALEEVRGSCPINEVQSAKHSTPMKFQESFGKDWDYHKGDCVACKTRYTQVGPCSICKDCEKKFDEEAA